MASDLKKIKINREAFEALNATLWEVSSELDEDLILRKNAEYGDSWQAEGPFLAASRMKDKITRVATTIEGQRKVVSAQAKAEGFQDILEMIAYGKMLMLYWAVNDLGLSGTEEGSTVNLYNQIQDTIQFMPNAFE